MDDKVTTWSPDTCGCVVSYSWDSSTSEDARVHSAFCVGSPVDADNPVALLSRWGVCDVHAHLDVDPRTHPGNAGRLVRLDWHVRRAAPLYDAIVRETAAKNNVREAIRRVLGVPDNEFVFDHAFAPGPNGERKLVVAAGDLSAGARNAARAAAAKERVPVEVV